MIFEIDYDDYSKWSDHNGLTSILDYRIWMSMNRIFKPEEIQETLLALKEEYTGKKSIEN